MKRCVFYLRRSTELQEQSVNDQRQALQSFADQHGFAVVREFVDDMSGTSVEGREAFKAMIQLALTAPRPFEAVLAWDIRRFSRGDNDEAGYYRHQLRLHGIEVIYVTENLTGDDADDLLIGTKQWLARQESKDKARATIRGMLSLIEKGFWAGGAAPYVYRRALYNSHGQFLRVLEDKEPSRKAPGDRIKLVVGDPLEAATVRRIFESYVTQEIGIRKIVGQLNREGVLGPGGRHWTYVTAQTMLRNPAYKGATSWNKQSKGRFFTLKKENGRPEAHYLGKQLHRRAYLNPVEHWVIVDGTHEPIVSPELFAQAQARRRIKARSRFLWNGRGANSPYRLSGLLTCGRCGTRLHGHTKQRKGHVYQLYVCGGFSQAGPGVCREIYIYRDALESYALRRIKERFLASGQWLKLVELLKEELGKETNPDASLAAHLSARLKQIDERINVLLDTISPDNARLINQKLDALRQDKEQLERQQELLTQRKATSLNVDQVVQEILGSVQRLDEVMATAPYPEQKAFVRTFIGRYTVYPDSAEAVIGFYRIPRHQQLEYLLGSPLPNTQDIPSVPAAAPEIMAGNESRHHSRKADVAQW